MNHYVVHLKLKYYCKSTIPQFKNKLKKKNSTNSNNLLYQSKPASSIQEA